MPYISRFFGITIYIYFREHGPPHFHAKYGGDEVSVEIKTLKVSQGRLSPRCMGMVMEWALLHQAELMEAWDKASNMETPQKIDPLK